MFLIINIIGESKKKAKSLSLSSFLYDAMCCKGITLITELNGTNIIIINNNSLA